MPAWPFPYWAREAFPKRKRTPGTRRTSRGSGVTDAVRRARPERRSASRTVALSDGSTLAFDDLLIATGSSPRASGDRRCRPSGRGAAVDACGHRSRLQRADALQAAGRTSRAWCSSGAGFVGFIVLETRCTSGRGILPWSSASPRPAEGCSTQRPRNTRSAGLRRATSRSTAARRCAEFASRRTGRSRSSCPTGRSLAADIVILATGVRANLDLLQDRALPRMTGSW